MKRVITYALLLTFAMAAPAFAKSAKKLQGTVNVNTASVQELMLLPGVGEKSAKKIIAARPFKSVDQLMKVKGISTKRLEKMEAYVALKGPTTAKAVKVAKNSGKLPQGR